MNADRMERFFTPVMLSPTPCGISTDEPVWTVGSCFSDEIGRRMAAGGFNVLPNPLGTLFNPASICRQLRRVVEGAPYVASDLYELNGLWHSPDFHSSFSDPDRDRALEKMNGAISRLHGALPSLQWLILTLGSARAFVAKDTGCVVANCHKLPAACFEVRDLSLDEITDNLSSTISLLRLHAPQMKVVFTVSPVRHKSYGMHADKLSKSRLLLAADALCNSLEDIVYFPAYEILDDELRDYRFYAADMVHPSEVAAEYIYTRFAETFFSPRTAEEARLRRKRNGGLGLKP